LLSASERERHKRYLVDDARDQYLLGRAMVRTALATVASVSAAQWVFGHNAHGRPHIEAPSLRKPLHFNLSHAVGLVAVAVCDWAEIGIDVENVKRRLSWENLAASYFSAGEQAVLAQTASDQRRARFFEIWTLREAYVKARGLGLSLPFDRFQFVFDDDAVALACRDDCGDEGERWQFFRYRPTADHALSLALAAGATQVTPSLVWLPEKALYNSF
jgi:4'-phosphopantetheinyl transferase